MNPVESPKQFFERYIHTPPNEGESAPGQLIRMIGDGNYPKGGGK